jgi:hypothetical protein
MANRRSPPLDSFQPTITSERWSHGNAKPVSVGTVTDRAHDGDDLLDRRRIGRILLALVARRAASVIARHRRGRATMPSGVQQHGFHESSLRMGSRSLLFEPSGR